LYTSDETAIGWEVNNTTAVESKIDVTFSSTLLNASDRILIKFYANNLDNASRTIKLYTEGSQHYSYVVTTLGSQGGTGGTGSIGSQGGTGGTGSLGSQGGTGGTGSIGSQGGTGGTGSIGSQGSRGSLGSTGSSANSVAQWALSGGGTVTYDGSSILWSTRVIAIPVEKTEISNDGYIDINCPTSGTIVYYNGSNVTTTMPCGAAGVPINSWEALYYEITPGQSQASDQTKFRLVNYQNSTWSPNSNWFLICTKNADSAAGHLKWIPGQFNFPESGGIYYSNTGLNNWQIAGTTSYIPKFTGANKIGNSNIYDSSGNIGIGTTSFAYASANRGLLEIYGSTDSLIGLKN